MERQDQNRSCLSCTYFISSSGALDAFNDLNARYMIPQQWGTFHLGDEPPGYSILELRRKITERRLDASRFITLDIGEILPLVQ
jgi:N-acyl-phosphatidylethanolamine-hydrolysing phospholipase D